MVGDLPAGRFQPWCGVSPDLVFTASFRFIYVLACGLHGRRRDVTEDGVTASGYGAENASEVRAVRYSPVGDEVIPSNTKNASLARRVECLQPT